jgi:hypothetical protein
VRLNPILGALLSFAGSIAFMVAGFQTWKLSQAFSAQDVMRVTGTVDALQYVGGRHSAFLASYHFDAQGVTRWIRSQQIGERTWRHLSFPGTLPVKYLLGDGSVSRIDLPTEDQYQNNEWTSIIGTVVFLVVGCIFLFGPRKKVFW